MCSNLPQPGTFAYEVFKKLPNLPQGGLSKLIGNNGFNNIGNNFPNFQIPGSNSNFIPNIDPSKFINNVPSESIKGNDSNLNDLIEKKDEDVVIKKVFKSNYNDLVKKHQKDGGKWTDPDFPPDQSSIGNVEDLPVRATWKRIPEVIKNPEFIHGKI